MDAWMYTWKNKLPVNEIYRYYDRSGCWPCPFGLIYRSFIMKQSHPKLHGFIQKMNALSDSYSMWVRPCTEGKPMKHLRFSNESFMNAVARLLPDFCDNFELHNDENIICVPNSVSQAKLNRLVKKARVNLIDAR
jgi:hypothetical protein